MSAAALQQLLPSQCRCRCSIPSLRPTAWTVSRWQPFSSKPVRRRSVMHAAGSSDFNSYPDTWWHNLTEGQIVGPVPPEPPEEITTDEQGLTARLGDRQYQRYVRMMQQHNQTQWDYYRSLARERSSRGEMPSWFNPQWLSIQEAPPNTFWRQQGFTPLQVDTTWLGDGGNGDDYSGRGGGNGNGKGSSRGGGSGWWREDDPYWPLRNWGEHPMRWWTWGFAALLAAGGAWCYATSGSTESLCWGCGAAGLLALGAMAMSDMTDDNPMGHLGVKLAWATCVAVAVKEFASGWAHQANRYWLLPRERHLEATGWAAAGMAALYMLTGMSGLWQIALPTNPGEAFKWADVGAKYLVWDYWGYGDYPMR